MPCLSMFLANSRISYNRQQQENARDTSIMTQTRGEQSSNSDLGSDTSPRGVVGVICSVDGRGLCAASRSSQQSCKEAFR